MFLRYMLPVFILVVSSLFAAYRYEHPACQEGVDSTVQNGWPGSFDVRIEKIPESCAFFAAVAGANYRISSKQTGENAWRQIATVHHDDPLDVPIDHVVVVNKDVAYVFWHNIYAVTTDRAQTWTIWSAEKDLVDWKRPEDRYPHWADIEKIDLRRDGSGTMYLDRNDKSLDLIRKLSTKDYGKSWTPQ